MPSTNNAGTVVVVVDLARSADYYTTRKGEAPKTHHTQYTVLENNIELTDASKYLASIACLLQLQPANFEPVVYKKQNSHIDIYIMYIQRAPLYL